MKPEEKNSLAVIKQELAKLKNTEDEKVKIFYASVTKVMTELSKTAPTEEKEDNSDDDKKDEKESKTDDNNVEKEDDKEKEESVDSTEDVESEKKAEDTKTESSKKEEKELSMEVSKKLSEAAIELTNYEKNLLAKDEIILVKDAKIVELNKKLQKYEELEQIELEKRLNGKFNHLIELYKLNGIEKDIVELKNVFSEEQVDKLIIDLSAMTKPAGIAKTVRQTALSVDLELSKYSGKLKTEKGMSEADRAQAIFFE